MLGKAQTVVKQCSAALVHSFQRVQGQGLGISGKTFLLASQPKLVQHIAANAQAGCGINVKSVTACRYLGLEISSKRRSASTVQGRMRKAFARAVRIKGLIESLTRAGFKSQASRGPAGQGAAPATLLEMRGLIAAVSGVQRHGGCAAVVLRLGFTQLDDPLAFGRFD